MTEQFVLQYIPQHIRQLGFNNYHLQYRDMEVKAETNQTIEAYNELYFIIEDPQGVIVESDYGLYDTVSDPNIPENVHLHRGEIVISNPGLEAKRIKFIQVIIIN